jgi:hypothetical protein
MRNRIYSVFWMPFVPHDMFAQFKRFPSVQLGSSKRYDLLFSTVLSAQALRQITEK